MIETVMYVAILAVISAVVFDMIITTATFYGRSRVRRTLNEQGAFILERMVREIRLAHSVNYSKSVFGAHPGSLELNTIVSPQNTSSTTRRFSIQSPDLFLQEGGSSPIPLSRKVTIKRLVFYEVWVQESGGATYYVRKSGSDGNNGLSSTTAFATIGKAASVMSAGDTVRVGAGIYNETVVPAQSGATSTPVSYIADRNGFYTGDKGATVLDGKNSLCHAFDLSSGRNFLVIDGFEATNYKSCSSEDAAFHFAGGNTNNIYRNLIARDTKRDGFVIGGSNNTLENCLAHDSGDDGLEIKGDNNTVRNCTFTKPNGFALESDTSQINLYENNIFDGDIGPSISNFTLSTFYNNDWVNGSSLSGSNNIQSDPLFVNKTNNDFHLSQTAAGQSSNSPAYNTGSTTASARGLGAKTTRTDSAADEGIADMGFHHPNGDTKTRAIRIEMTLEAGEGRSRIEETFYGTAVLRGSY